MFLCSPWANLRWEVPTPAHMLRAMLAHLASSALLMSSSDAPCDAARVISARMRALQRDSISVIVCVTLVSSRVLADSCSSDFSILRCIFFSSAAVTTPFSWRARFFSCCFSFHSSSVPPSNSRK